MKIERRFFLTRILPGLPFLPKAIDRIANPPQVVDLKWAESARRLLDGSVQRSRQMIQVWSNGARKVVEDVAWRTKNGNTVDGSTVWKKWLPPSPNQQRPK